MEPQVISKQRVADHGEVYTRPQEVDAMLDLVKRETERIESRFLEPACGTGNFLTEVLERKLSVVQSRHQKCQLEYERNAVLAVSSIYGIDVLEDNVVECRKRLFAIFDEAYARLFKHATKVRCKDAIIYILDQNIIWGDARTLEKMERNPAPIVFPEWSPVNGSMIKRRDFTFCSMFESEITTQSSVFLSDDPLKQKHPTQESLISDLGEGVFIPIPVNEYPVIHFLKIGDVK